MLEVAIIALLVSWVLYPTVSQVRWEALPEGVQNAWMLHLLVIVVLVVWWVVKDHVRVAVSLT